jgi:acyl dehydratase
MSEFKSLQIGQKASIKKRFTEEEVFNYANTSGDRNLIHLDKEYAKNSVFGQRIVHGLLVTSLFGGLLGSKLPGEGTIHLSQSIQFKKPIYIDEEVTAELEIIHIREDKQIVTLQAKVYKENNELAFQGESVVKVMEFS